MGELIQAIEQNLADEEAGIPAEAPKAEPAQEVPPDNTTLQAGVEEVAKAQAEAEEAEEAKEAEDAKPEAEVDATAEEAGEADESGGDRPEAEDPEFAEEGLDEPEEVPLTAEDVPEDLEFDVKVDGETSKVPLKELIDSYQLSTFSRQQIQKAKEMQTGLQRTQLALIKDPMFALEQLFAGQFQSQDRAHQVLRIVVGEWMNNEFQYEQMPPEQRRIWDEKRQLELEKQRLTEERNQGAQQGQQAALADARSRAEAQLKAALRSTGLGEDPVVRQAVIQEWHEKTRSGIPLTAEQAANIVKDRRAKAFEDLAKTLPDDELIERFPELAKKLSAAGRKRVREKKKSALTSTKTGEAAPDKEPTKPVRRGKKPKRFTSGSEFFDHLENKYPR